MSKLARLVVNSGEFEFRTFEKAVHVLGEEFGYQGLAWDMVVASGDFDILFDFLNDNEVDAVLSW